MSEHLGSKIDFKAIERRSRFGSLLTAVGFLVIAGVVGASVLEVGRLQQNLGALNTTIRAKQKTLQDLNSQVSVVRTQLATSKEQISKSAFLLGTGNVEGAKQGLAQAASLQSEATVGRVFFEIRSADQRPTFQQCAKLVLTLGYKVPGPELVSNRGPKETSLRYFHKADAGEAEKLAGTISKCTAGPASVTLIGGYEDSPLIKPRQFEVWFAPNAG
jgi:hypothetical protein